MLTASAQGGIARGQEAGHLHDMTLERLDWAVDHLSGEIHALQKAQRAAAELSKDSIAQLLTAFHEADARQNKQLQRLEEMLRRQNVEARRNEASRNGDMNAIQTSTAANGLDGVVQALERTQIEHAERMENQQLDIRQEVQATAMKWLARGDSIEETLERNHKEIFERLQRLQLDMKCEVPAKVAEQAVGSVKAPLQPNTTLNDTAYCLDANMDSDKNSDDSDTKRDLAAKKALLGKQNLLKDPVVNPVTREDLISWSENVAEEFNAKQFVVELVGQTIWLIFGILGIPLLLPLYGCSMNALRNRSMWMRSRPGKGFGTPGVAAQMLLSAMIQTSVVIIIVVQPEHTNVTDVVLVLMFVLLRCLTIAIKYGFVPRAVWNQMNVVAWDESRLVGLTLVGAWLTVSKETADLQVDWALLTSVGLVEEEPELTFLQPTTADNARAIQALQGKTTRRLVAEILAHEDSSCLPQGLKLEHDRAPALEEAGWPAKVAAGKTTMSLREFFAHLIQVVLQAEKKSPIGVFGAKGMMVVTLAVTLTPCFGRLIEGRPFMGNSILAYVSISIYWLPLFACCLTSFLFLYVAIRDMWRRRALMQCCTALLSMMPQDRIHIPWQVKVLGVIDTRDVKTMEAFLHLRDLCKDWGSFYSLRCTFFVNAFTVVTACLLAALLACIQFELYDHITKSILLAALVNPALLLLCIVQLAVLGEGVNSTSGRLSMLLQRHASAITESALGLGLKEGDECPEDTLLRQALKGIKSAKTNISLDQDSVKLLGQRCGIGILTALYALPVYVAMRVRDLCEARPQLCTL